MKYKVNFKLKNNILKSDYRRIFVSFFKKAISNYMDGYFYNSLYGGSSEKKHICWSIGLNNPIFNKELITLGSTDLEMTIKTDNNETALIYFSSMLEMKDKPFNIGNDNQLILKSIRLVKEPEIIGDFSVFKILSPICIRLHDRETNKDIYVDCNDESFQKELKQKLKEDLEYYDEEIDRLEFDFSNLKKVIVPAYGLMIPTTIGMFLVRGDNKVLNSMNNRGIGSRKGSGFGLIEAIY